MTGTGLGAEDTVENKADNSPALMGLSFLVGETKSLRKQMNINNDRHLKK